jgi:hypothetical protein
MSCRFLSRHPSSLHVLPSSACVDGMECEGGRKRDEKEAKRSGQSRLTDRPPVRGSLPNDHPPLSSSARLLSPLSKHPHSFNSRLLHSHQPTTPPSTHSTCSLRPPSFLSPSPRVRSSSLPPVSL